LRNSQPSLPPSLFLLFHLHRQPRARRLKVEGLALVGEEGEEEDEEEGEGEKEEAV